MPSSESEDFESADEGIGNIEKKDRKKRHSSSNYSDNALENDPAPLKAPAAIVKKVTKEEKQVYNIIVIICRNFRKYVILDFVAKTAFYTTIVN